ncbi:MAG: HAMP domain-containing histidine kinase [Eudoraea sp.]|nr:HAMP domain-containing histidine kinase [Eudoraea sp.]
MTNGSGKKIKLLKKSSRNYLVTGVILMVLSLVTLYFLTQYFIRDETDEALNSTLYRIEKLLEEKQPITSVQPLIDIQKTAFRGATSLKDTLIMDPLEGEEEIFRQLSAYKDINGTTYKISIRTLLVESEDILLAILASYIGIITLIFLAQFYFSRRNAKVIWKPFFENLDRVKEFSLHSNKKISFVETDIMEFSELNSELQTLTDKVILDYKNLKQFTEDISHELQTPLAIIQAKIGNFIDDNEISTNQFKLLSEIQQNVQRLSGLNKKLVLLAKIENQQFMASETINITDHLTKAVEHFQEMSSIPINYTPSRKIEIRMDATLAQVLVDNLISNAVKHCSKEGSINVDTIDNTIIIANSGNKSIAEPEKLYDRFYQESVSKKSLGLGLAIVKKICDSYNLKIDYRFENKFHYFRIQFP